MEQINEKQLKEISIYMNKKTIELKVKGILIVEFTMHKVQCRYNQRSGMLTIYDKTTDKRLIVETFMAYMLCASEDRQMLEIKLDNDEEITIKIV